MKISIFKILILVLLFQSCDIYKQASKSKTDTDFKEQIETKTFRKGDTVTYLVPKISYKDTTIYTTNRQGTTLKTVYNTQGQIASIDCFASVIEEFKKENRELKEFIKEKDSEKKEEVNTTWILYGFAMIAFLGGIALFLMYKTINRNSLAVAETLKNISK